MKQLQQSTQNLSPSAPATPGPTHGSNKSGLYTLFQYPLRIIRGRQRVPSRVARNIQDNGQGGGGGDEDDDGIPLVPIPPLAAQQQRHRRDQLALSKRAQAGSSASEQRGKSSVSK